MVVKIYTMVAGVVREENNKSNQNNNSLNLSGGRNSMMNKLIIDNYNDNGKQLANITNFIRGNKLIITNLKTNLKSVQQIIHDLGKLKMENNDVDVEINSLNNLEGKINYQLKELGAKNQNLELEISDTISSLVETDKINIHVKI
jgi:hypothetical protein